MGSKRVKYSTQIYAFLDDNPKFKLKALQDEFKHFNPETVNTNFKRWHKKRTSPKKSKRSGSISKNSSNTSTPKKPITPLSPELQNIKNIMQTFNNNNRTNVRFGEIAKYLETLGQLNILAEGVTQSLKPLNNSQLLDYIKPTPLLSGILPEKNLQDCLKART